jgi:hypothetical protein
MSKINIKIVEVEQSTNSVLVKYASENSKKTIDEYPAVAFQVNNFPVSTIDEFIEAIRPQISLYVYLRDLSENPIENLDISSWGGHTVQVDAYELPAEAPPPVPALDSPEVTL